MDSLLQDVRYGIRALSSKPGFTVVAVLTIALGIGANTAMFTVVNAVLLRALPYPHPEQLVRITADLRGTNIPDIGLSVPELTDYREKLEAIDQIAGVWPISANVTGSERSHNSGVSSDPRTRFQASPKSRSSATRYGGGALAAIPRRLVRRSGSITMFTRSSV